MDTHPTPAQRQASMASAGKINSPVSVSRLRDVAWTNLWNRCSAYDRDGVGTKTHLTASEGLTGTTLCGKSFPSDKGYPSTWGAGYCKRCLKKARALGYDNAMLRGLKAVPSRESY